MGGRRFARLADDWLLRGWRDVPWAAVNWTRGAVRTLSEDAFHVARACDAKTDFRSAAFLPIHRAILDTFIGQGLAVECQPDATLHAQQPYRRAANPFLRGLHWSVTSRCNLRCRHCIVDAPSRRYRDLDRAEAFALIDQFERANVPQVALTGGEPFMRRDLAALIGRLVERRIGITEIATNGLLVTDRRLDLFRRHDLRPIFRISFDGCGTHDAMRGLRGAEARVVRAIERLRAGGHPVVVITSVDRLSADALPRTYDLMKRLGVVEWCVGIPAEAGAWRSADTGLSLSQTIDACFDLARRWRDDGRPMGLWLWRFGRLAQGPNRTPPGPAEWNCPGTHVAPYVLSDGTLLPCGGYTDSPMADSMPNLLETELSSAWADSEVRRIADLRPRDVAARNRSCARCEFFPRCRGGCRVRALRATGNPMAKDTEMCALWKRGTIERLYDLVNA